MKGREGGEMKSEEERGTERGEGREVGEEERDGGG